jgi:hypothetical protein
MEALRPRLISVVMSIEMNLNNHKEIEEITYPPEHRASLERLTPLLIQAIERDGPPIESGQINLGNINDEFKLPLFFFYWIAESNEVIDNLNLVLSDLRNLPTGYVLLSGSPRKRYYLLVRLYFYEFYRFREIFNRVVRGLQGGGYIKRAQVPKIRNIFNEAFEHTIEVRNNLVHGSPLWKGQKHFNLMLVGGARELGFALGRKETGRLWDISEVLKDLCDPTADVMRDEGNRMSMALQNTVRLFVKLTSKV